VDEVRAAVLPHPVPGEVVVDVDVVGVHLRDPGAVAVPGAGVRHSDDRVRPRAAGVLVRVEPVPAVALELQDVALRWPAVDAGQPEGGPGAPRRGRLELTLDLPVGKLVVDGHV